MVWTVIERVHACPAGIEVRRNSTVDLFDAFLGDVAARDARLIRDHDDG
jgi:hypothetical protein